MANTMVCDVSRFKWKHWLWLELGNLYLYNVESDLEWDKLYSVENFRN